MLISIKCCNDQSTHSGAVFAQLAVKRVILQPGRPLAAVGVVRCVESARLSNVSFQRRNVISAEAEANVAGEDKPTVQIVHRCLLNNQNVC